MTAYIKSINCESIIWILYIESVSNTVLTNENVSSVPHKFSLHLMRIVISRKREVSLNLWLSFSNRNAVSSVLSVSSKFHARIHTLLQTMEHRDVARLKSPTATGRVMNELNLRKDRHVQGLLQLYLFIFHPSALDLLCPNGWYKFSYKWVLNDNVTAVSAVEERLGDDALKCLANSWLFFQAFLENLYFALGDLCFWIKCRILGNCDFVHFKVKWRYGDYVWNMISVI